MNSDGRRPFAFRKIALLVEATKIKASSLAELLTGVTLAEDLSIVYHLHRHFFVNPDTLPEYSNDFASWVGDELGNAVVAERLANLNLFRAAGVSALRREIAVILAESLAQERDGVGSSARARREFIFCNPRPVVLPCRTVAAAPAAFPDALRVVEIQSVGYHVFLSSLTWMARNDFAIWFDTWGEVDLARELETFDPYLNCLEDTRKYLIELTTRGLSASGGRQ